MNYDTKRKVKTALSTALLVGATALASSVTIPYSFTPGSPARAADVNANFSAVKASVDDNHTRLQTAEGQVGTLQGNVTTLQGNITALQSDVGTLQSTVSTLQSTVGTLNTSVTTLNSTTWRRGGNTGTNPATDYLGTADTAQLDLRVNAASVMRLAEGRVGVNTVSPPADIELTVQGMNNFSGDYANLFLRQYDRSEGFLVSVGDATPTSGAWFYVDSYDSANVNQQRRRLVITDQGFLAVNRGDTFVSGVGNVPLMVGDGGRPGNGAYLSAGGTWTNGSSREFKRAVKAIDPEEVLETLVGLPISSWEYKSSDEGRHLGPMAEDFAAAFKLGKDPQRIATVDEAGVALAAIQGLNTRLERENAELARRLAVLERRLAALETE
ncbi:MAG: tail fiber domain-containing protein [Myxococcota bacterium]